MLRKETQDWLNEQFLGDKEMIATVWAEYERSAREKIESSRAALAASDYTRLDRLAHTLKGDALLVGDQAVVQEAIALRAAAVASDATGAATTLDRIAEAVGAQTLD